MGDKVKIAHVFIDYEEVELPDFCPKCGTQVEKEMTHNYYFVEADEVSHDKLEMHRGPLGDSFVFHDDCLIMVQCGGYDCGEIFASSPEVNEPEFFDRLRSLRDAVNEFLEED